MEDVEIWRPVKGYEGLYEVSDLGQVRSLNYCGSGRRQILKQVKDRYGYMYVGLSNCGRHKHHKVHRLVVDAFLPPDPLRPYTDNINGIRTDNRLCNLKRCTQSENMMNPHTRRKYRNYLETNGTSMYSHPMSEDEKNRRKIRFSGTGNPMFGKSHSESAIEKMRNRARTRTPKNYKMVAQYTRDWELLKVWNGVVFAAKETGIHKSSIAGCCRNEKGTAGGFVWKYIEKI